MRRHIAMLVILSFTVLFPIHALSDLYTRSPDVLPGTISEMREQSWWINQMKNPDEIILSLSEIQMRNREYREKMAQPDPFADVHPGRIPLDWQLDRWPGRFAVKPEIDQMADSELKEMIRTQINALATYIIKEKYGNYLGTEYSPEELDLFIAETATRDIVSPIAVSHGIVVRPSRLRVIPAPFPDVVGITNIDGTNYTVDRWTLTRIGTGSLVIVLHRSQSGSHLFVMSDNNFGWIETEDIAFGSKDVLSAYTQKSGFMICTGNRVPYYSEKSCRYVSGWYSMSEKIYPAGKGDSRRILVPYRKSDGTFSPAEAWLAQDADAHTGYMTYTRRNIVEQAFKLLGDPYDWTGAAMGRNHETTYRDIFACFGFILPHNGGLFTHFGNKDTAAMPGIGKDAAYDLILGNEPFVSIAIVRGHAMLFLGEYKEVPILFDQSGYSYTGPDGVQQHVKSFAIITPNVVPYLLDYPITFLELK